MKKKVKSYGEAGVAKSILPIDRKLVYRGKKYMFMEFSSKHAGDTIRMFCPNLKSVIVTRDVVWLKIYFSSANKVDKSVSKIAYLSLFISMRTTMLRPFKSKGTSPIRRNV